MQKPYTEIENILKKVDFDAIWKGFTPCDFALTSWPSEKNVELLTMKVIREMFHVFQTQQGESRKADEAAISAYPHDLDNYHLKAAEIHYLIKAFGENSEVDFEQFAVLRRARKRIIGDAFKQELLIETFEGMAEYAGMMALRQISHQKFMLQLEKQLIYLRNPENLFNVQRVSCFVGSILCMTLKALGIDFYHNLSESQPLFDLVKWKPTVIDISSEKFHQKLRR